MEETYAVYDVIIDDDSGIYTISLVELPAIKQFFMVHSEDQEVIRDMNFKLSEDKYRLTGPVLIANQLIKRNISTDPNNPEIAYIRYSFETIEKMAQNFISHPEYHKFNLEHGDKFIDANLVGSQVDYDKKAMFITIKSDTPFTDEFLKNFNGFSIEAKADLKQADVLTIKQSEKIKSKEMKVKEMISSLIKLNIKQAIDIYELTDGLLFMVDTETNKANYLKDDGSIGEYLAPGIYDTKDGVKFEIGEEGEVLSKEVKEEVDPIKEPVSGDDSMDPVVEPVVEQTLKQSDDSLKLILERLKNLEDKMAENKKVILQSETKEEVLIEDKEEYTGIFALANNLKKNKKNNK